MMLIKYVPGVVFVVALAACGGTAAPSECVVDSEKAPSANAAANAPAQDSTESASPDCVPAVAAATDCKAKGTCDVRPATVFTPGSGSPAAP
jgi:hypothetical protein